MTLFPKLAGKLYARAEKEFYKLDSIESLVYITQFEIDLFESGHSELTAVEIKPHRKFVKKWKGK